jgi:hypothetical protein
MTHTPKRIAITGAAIAALAAAATAGATGQDPGDDDVGEARQQLVEPTAAEQARRAALEVGGGGSVTEVERADEGGDGFEVEVRRPDGSYVEVGLDRGFRVTSLEPDTD